MVKKTVIVASDNFGAREIFSKIISDHPDVEFFLVITTGLYYKKSFAASIFKMLSEASFAFCFSRFLELFKYKLKRDTLFARAKNRKIQIYFTNDINGNECHSVLKTFSPDLICSTFTMHILKNNIIQLPAIATIGCHPSILPHYRGLEVFFWALANEEKESGVSVFHVSEKIDSGKVILQERFKIDDDETVKSIYEKLTFISARLMSQAVQKFKNNESFSTFPYEGSGSYYRMPTVSAYRKFKKAGKKWK